MVPSDNTTLAPQKSYLTFEDEVVRSIEFRELSYIRRFFFAIGCILTCGILALVCHWFHRLYVIMNYRKCSAEKSTKIVITDEYKNCHDCDRISYNENGKIIHMFLYKRIPFSFDENAKQFVPVRFNPSKPFYYYENVLSKGVYDHELKKLKAYNGKNSIEVPITPLYKLILDEGLHPFICFQIFSIIVWSLYDYYYYAVLVGVITIFTVISQIVQTRINMRNLQEMTRFESKVKVYRNGKEGQIISSYDLVPGDVFEAENDMTLPCDALLLSGQCIMNETMLTGESVPVIKTSIPHCCPPQCNLSENENNTQQINSESASSESQSENPEKEMEKTLPFVKPTEILNMERDKSYILFGGTKVIRARSLPSTLTEHTRPVCIAIRTSFSTAKGQLVRSILYPRPTKFKFFEDSFKFIGVLACLALIGFIVNAVIQTMYGEELLYIILRAGDLVTIAVPPTLPAVMSAGVSYAIARLKKDQIFCIASQRVNVAGKVKVMCFDKTGTLTEDGLSVLGVQDASKVPIDALDVDWAHTENHMYPLPPAAQTEATTSPTGNEEDSIIAFSSLKTETEELNSLPEIMSALSTCHSIATVDGANVGDPLDVKMFEFTKWNMTERGGDSELQGLNSIDSQCSKWIDEKTAISSSYQAIVYPSENNSNNQMNESVTESSYLPSFVIGILRRFEFSSHLQRMSVITHKNSMVTPDSAAMCNSSSDSCLTQSASLDIYTKGSPEALLPLCTQSSIPSDFHSKLASFTQRGLRVLALGHKTIQIPMKSNVTLSEASEQSTPKSLDYEVVNKMPREEVEHDLTFLGFFIMENKLKDTTTASISRLTAAGIRSLMVTGDNPLTAINVARECGLIPSPPLHVPSSAEEEAEKNKKAERSSKKKSRKTRKNQVQTASAMDAYPVFMAELDKNKNEVVWRSQELPGWTLDPETLYPIKEVSADEETIISDGDFETSSHRFTPVVATPPINAQVNDLQSLTSSPVTESPSRTSLTPSASANPPPSATPASNFTYYSMPYPTSSPAALSICSASSASSSSSESSACSIEPNDTASIVTQMSKQVVIQEAVIPNSEQSNEFFEKPIKVDAVKFHNVKDQSCFEIKTHHSEQSVSQSEDNNVFADWCGGPWGPVYWRGIRMPSSFVPSQEKESSSLQSPPPSSAYFLAVTGPAFRHMYNEYQQQLKTQNTTSLASLSDYTNHKSNKLYEDPTLTCLFRKVCFLSPVFARMSPDDKAHLVETLIDMGFITGMCGDGSNDCGALKAAHVGISLSEVEASIAAPFTSKNASIGCVETLIREGRGALASSFNSFKATAIFSMIQFISTAILIGYDTMLSDFDFLVLDILMTLPILFTTGYAKPSKTLSHKTPQGSLISFPVISSLFVHIAITFIVQFGATLVMKQCYDYVPMDPSEEDYDLHIESYETTTVFLSSLVSYFVSGLVINLTDSYLQPLYSNWLLCVALLFVFGIMAFTFLQEWSWFTELMQMVRLEDSKFIIYSACALVVSFIVLAAIEYGISKPNLPKKISRALNPKKKYHPKTKNHKVNVSDPTDANSCSSERNTAKSEASEEKAIKTAKIRCANYKKPYYALIHQMQNEQQKGILA
ncbi:putative ATPase type 13A2 [Monocercomonoides exilis]|uniref:putative ATPase type 13A2 n=1 Tax=Monocercomonoides exilis TaxID=2049356 RepID=UPI00355AC038|nr:putative ATPase type 13A2 [Monocercomonoides exilis]|eukprot:MONOS_1016.1-p1 / transcript=MONOS_1016.1 / gene=MONOS_1016 / organism=Monocercomonoides_exilis_PA203 / gene_product=ATPase type 13A2 / transcript_product=ATPase type 13A2 / location=Mono_scaffold00017:52142-56944(+) / protein_length=1600 / sequence_SO=supercontig / SO=protein_coding / is_pseudo=false